MDDYRDMTVDELMAAYAAGRAAALAEVDAAIEALATRLGHSDCALAPDYDGWYVSHTGSNGHRTPTAAILAAAAALTGEGGAE